MRNFEEGFWLGLCVGLQITGFDVSEPTGVDVAPGNELRVKLTGEELEQLLKLFSSDPRLDPSFDAAFDRVTRIVHDRRDRLAAEREDAPRLLLRLEPPELPNRTTEQKLVLLNNDASFHTWGFCEHLLELSWESRCDDMTP